MTEVVNPSTGETVADVALADTADADAAVRAAHDALPAWAADEDARRAALNAVVDVLEEHADELAAQLHAEIGISERDAQGEVMMAAGMVAHRASATPLPVDVLHDDEKQCVQVVRAPVGVVAAIVPWNAPLLIACEKLASSLAAGDTVVLKPSPLAPLTLLRLGELLADVLPAGVLGVVCGSDDVGAHLTVHPDVAMVSFTGSISAGRAIMASAAPSLKRLSLELGGNDAAIVLPGAAAEELAPKLFAAALYRSGQLCAAVKRVYVHEDELDAFAAALAQVAEAAAQDIGPLSNAPQLERVAGLVDDALDAGATALTGGARREGPGFFYEPTIVTGAGPQTALVAEEQFGPVLPVLPYADLDDAVAQANATEYGLGASVWGDADAAAPVAARLQAGSVWVNRHGLLAPGVPFGGMKQSGIGRANGAVGIDAYCELKTISIAKGSGGVRRRESAASACETC